MGFSDQHGRSDRAATVSRADLLVGGSDAAFRRMIHAMLSFSRNVITVRDGFGTLIGVSGVQYELLMSVQRLQGGAGVAVGEVAGWMQRSGAFITIESGKLVAAGLLHKNADPTDRRRMLLRLTAEAEARLAALAPVQAEVNDALFDALNARNFARFAQLVDMLLPCGVRAATMIRDHIDTGANHAEDR